MNPCRYTKINKYRRAGTYFNIQFNKLFFYLYVTDADKMHSIEIRSADIRTFLRSNWIADPISNGSLSIITNQESMSIISEQE